MSKPTKKVLLIEDDPLIVEIYTTKLKESGFDVDSVFDGEEALRKIGEKKYDILLLDVVLPHLTGFELLEKIKKQEIGSPKIFILSNLSQREDVERAERLGASGYLIKAQYTPSEVVKEIRKALK